jgi:hypothetical protein
MVECVNLAPPQEAFQNDNMLPLLEFVFRRIS